MQRYLEEHNITLCKCTKQTLYDEIDFSYIMALTSSKQDKLLKLLKHQLFKKPVDNFMFLTLLRLIYLRTK